ncbi:hypothetical protein N7490_006447 [Penicillium lividum]|nr:hypothetical protein N7490_006447 [Penicillium lividum]
MPMLELLRRWAEPQGYGAGGANQSGGHSGEGDESTTAADNLETSTRTKGSQTNTNMVAASAATSTSGAPLGGNETTAESTSTTTTPTATSTATSTTATAAASHSGGESTTTKLAIALPIAIVGALAITAIVFFLIRRRRQQRAVPSSPTYDTADGKVISLTQIMAAPREPAPAGLPRFPMLDVLESRDTDVSPVSAGQMSAHDESHTQIGFGMAVSRDQRPNSTEQDLRGISGSASPANAVVSRIQSLENHGTADDAVSVVSDEQRTHAHDYDDMSSVSSFDGGSPRANDHQHPLQ